MFTKIPDAATTFQNLSDPNYQWKPKPTIATDNPLVVNLQNRITRKKPLPQTKTPDNFHQMPKLLIPHQTDKELEMSDKLPVEWTTSPSRGREESTRVEIISNKAGINRRR